MKKIVGNIVDLFERKIYYGIILIENGRIKNIIKTGGEKKEEKYIMPGFIDAHVHIESSMLIPENFGRLVASKGTVAVVTDPHEIANVMGVEGIDFMIENSKKAPIKIFFTIPSCVPATPMDASGSEISAKDTAELVKTGKFVGLSEMMNVPGVINGDKEVISKIKVSRDAGLPVDGHAPLLGGKDLLKYINAGISTDHECSNLGEAKEKLAAGMKIFIREGSASRNYEALKDLLSFSPENIMFCTDDAHPDDIIARGHIDKIVRMAVADGYDLFDVLRASSYNTAAHFKIDVGMLRPGDKADFIVVDNIKDFHVLDRYIDGNKLDLSEEMSFEEMEDLISGKFNKFNHDKIPVSGFKKKVEGNIPVIGITDGELFTDKMDYSVRESSFMESDTDKDIVKIVYVNRYDNKIPQVAFCHGTGLKKGAFASSVAHDSHNIIAVGTKDKDIATAVNAIIESKGGLSCAMNEKAYVLPLPVGGIISPLGGHVVAEKYNGLEEKVKEMGCSLFAPYMTLSFMSLLVIPEIKIGEKGLFYNWNFID